MTYPQYPDSDPIGREINSVQRRLAAGAEPGKVRQLRHRLRMLKLELFKRGVA